MTLRADGRVGVGTDTPSETLDVWGNVHVSNNISGNSLTINNVIVSTTVGLDEVLNVSNTSTNTIQITNVSESFSNTTGAIVVSGGVGVGSNLFVGKDLTVSGNVTINTVSLSTTTNFQEVTNDGNTTTNTIEFNNPTTSLVASGNVEVGTANLFVDTTTGNVGVGVTNPTTRFAVLDEARQSEEFPPRAMTDYETHMEGHGVFKVSESSVRSGEDGAYVLFSKDNGTTFWHSDNNSTDHQYTQDAAGTYSGTSSFDGIDGEWVTLECPYSIKLDSIQLYLRSLTYQKQSPEDWTLLGSNDGTNWGTLKEVTGQIISESGTSFNVITSQYYKMFALVVTRIANNVAGSYTNALTFGELKFFGTRERGQSTLHDGELKLTKSLMVPRIGPPLDADDTPRRDRLVVEYNTSTNPTENGVVRDTSGSGNDGELFNGAYYDATEKALVFDGSNDYIQTGTINGPTGQWPHSISLWFRANGEATETWDYLCQFGTNEGGKSTLVGLRNENISFATYSSARRGSGVIASNNIWYHVVAVYPGGTFFDTTQIYVNGIFYADDGGSSSDPYPLSFGSSGNFLMLGNRMSLSDSEFSGSISNFKLYDVALTETEVKRLYDMGRCDEGHHVANFSKTRVGIGLGDGEAPRAVLDVRGSIMSSGYILQQNAVCCRWINGGDKTVSSGVKIPFDGIVYDPNNLWNTVSDAFVAPVAGVYLVHVNLMTDNSTSYDGNHEVYVNGSVYTPRLRGFGIQTGQNYHRNANSHYMISLQAGDEVSINSTGNGVWYGSTTYAHSHVSIHLISDV
jgi:hypothetical protein